MSKDILLIGKIPSNESFLGMFGDGKVYFCTFSVTQKSLYKKHDGFKTTKLKDDNSFKVSVKTYQRISEWGKPLYYCYLCCTAESYDARKQPDLDNFKCKCRKTEFTITEHRKNVLTIEKRLKHYKKI